MENAARAHSTPTRLGINMADSQAHARRAALRFVVLIGILSFFADFTYEGSRSIIGPYLATLQATGAG